MALSGLVLQAVDGVVSSALCLKVMSQAPQHFRSTETHFPRHSICSVILLDSGLSSSVHPRNLYRLTVVSRTSQEAPREGTGRQEKREGGGGGGGGGLFFSFSCLPEPSIISFCLSICSLFLLSFYFSDTLP